MNFLLRKQIILHIFNLFGVLNGDLSSRLNKNLLKKKLSFENEDNKVIENKLWGGELEVDNSNISFMLGELTEEVPEFVLVLQPDSFPPYVIRISTDEDDGGSFVVYHSNQWVVAPMITQAKVLVAMESIFESFFAWEPLKNQETIYKTLFSFLKEESDNA